MLSRFALAPGSLAYVDWVSHNSGSVSRHRHWQGGGGQPAAAVWIMFLGRRSAASCQFLGDQLPLGNRPRHILNTTCSQYWVYLIVHGHWHCAVDLISCNAVISFKQNIVYKRFFHPIQLYCIVGWWQNLVSAVRRVHWVSNLMIMLCYGNVGIVLSHSSQ